jgi:multicomponent Na+:H+ antiporter subunit B
MKLISLIPVVAVGGLLLFAAKDFPEWGDPASPASTSPVSSHFIQNTGVDTEVPNMVTAVLADYRGFDTMFETVVVFIAGMAVLAILKGSGRRRSGKREHEVEAEPDLIVTNTVRLIVPVIQIFAFYVLAHGHVSPGGGFQGGVVMGASFILVALAWDLDVALARFSMERCILVAALGIVLYGGIGFLSMLLGGEFWIMRSSKKYFQFPGRWLVTMPCLGSRSVWVLRSLQSCSHFMRTFPRRVV